MARIDHATTASPQGEPGCETRILLVDDHAMMREALSALLGRQPGLRVVGEAADGQEAVERHAELRPDLTVMDISLPRMSGLVATRAILRSHPQARILILTMHERGSFVEEALQAGAVGYLLKSATCRELVDAIEAVGRGERFLSPAIAHHAVRRAASAAPAGQRLSVRERQVLQGIAEGLASKEVAERLCLSTRTVETHRANLMRKLGLRKSSALVRYAIREGLVPL